MMAAADYAQEKSVKPPEELSLALKCQRWNALPVTGGILDQPAGLVERMTIALNTYEAMKAWSARDVTKDAEFVKNYPDTWRIVQAVMELRNG